MAIRAHSRIAEFTSYMPLQHFQEFERGNFIVQILSGEFSRIHYGQVHEQSNKKIKSIKGPIDFVNLTSDELQRKWVIAGPEIAEYLE